MIISFIMEIIVSLKFFGNGLEEVNRAKNVIFDFFEQSGERSASVGRSELFQFLADDPERLQETNFKPTWTFCDELY